MDAEHRRHQHAEDFHRVRSVAQRVLGPEATVAEDPRPGELVISLSERHLALRPHDLQAPEEYLAGLIERAFRKAAAAPSIGCPGGGSLPADHPAHRNNILDDLPTKKAPA